MWKIFAVSAVALASIYVLGGWSSSAGNEESFHPGFFLTFAVVLPGFLSVCILGAVAFVLSVSHGRPITVMELEERIYYICHGALSCSYEKGFVQVVLVRSAVENATRMMAVKLQMKLPEKAEGFHVLPHYDHLHRKVPGKIEILVKISGSDLEHRMVIDLYTKEEQDVSF